MPAPFPGDKNGEADLRADDETFNWVLEQNGFKRS